MSFTPKLLSLSALFAVSLYFSGCSGNSTNQGSGQAGGQSGQSQPLPQYSGPQYPGSGTQNEFQGTMEWTCKTINFRQGGRDDAGGEKKLTLSSSDVNRIDVISENSLNRITLRSTRGKIQLETTDTENGFVRGKVEFPIDTPEVTLYPDNGPFERGFSWVNCYSKESVVSAHSGSVKWSCSVRNYLDDAGNPVSISREIEISARDENKDTVLFENRDVKVTTLGYYGRLTLKSEERESHDNLAASIDGFHSHAVTLYRSGFASQKSEQKVSCKKL